MLLNQTSILLASLALILPWGQPSCDCNLDDLPDPGKPECEGRHDGDCDPACRYYPPEEESPGEEHDPCEYFEPGVCGCPEEPVDDCKRDPKQYGCDGYEPPCYGDSCEPKEDPCKKDPKQYGCDGYEPPCYGDSCEPKEEPGCEEGYGEKCETEDPPKYDPPKDEDC